MDGEEWNAVDTYGTHLKLRSGCMVAVLAAVLCDASQYLVITVRNKLAYSQYIHSPLRGEI